MLIKKNRFLSTVIKKFICIKKDCTHTIRIFYGPSKKL